MTSQPFNSRIGGPTGGIINLRSHVTSVALNNADGTPYDMPLMDPPLMLQMPHGRTQIPEDSAIDLTVEPLGEMAYSSYKLENYGLAFYLQIKVNTIIPKRASRVALDIALVLSCYDMYVSHQQYNTGTIFSCMIIQLPIYGNTFKRLSTP